MTFTKCDNSPEEKCNKRLNDQILKALFQINSTKANILNLEVKKKMQDE